MEAQTSGNGGSSYGNSGGYGSYQGGSMAGSSKTGDVRPFKNDGCSWTYRNGTADRRCGDLQKNCFREKKYKGYAAEMKKLRTFAVSMIIAAIGLLIYCAGFYIKVMNRILQQGRNMQSFPKWQG